MWTAALPRWYAEHGRHALPWRATRDPWAVLVSEVMLQQTQVARVIPKWEAFLERWPAPEAFAQADLAEVLRAWQGLGYPRRARALHRCAQAIAAEGWPRTETGLRRLPGVGSYTARALLTLAFSRRCPPPLDVNIRRVGARAALGVEPVDATDAAVGEALEAARPRRMGQRDYTLALFDVGALHCRATPRCGGCPLAGECRRRGRRPAERAARGARRVQTAYAGSFRQLRGAVLRASLAAPGANEAVIARTVAIALGAPPAPEQLARAMRSLSDDGLLPGERDAALAG